MIRSLNACSRWARTAQLVALLAAGILTLSACSDGGGGAGDDGSDPGILEPSLVEPFVGLWEITGNWNGTPDDTAYLSFAPVDVDGTSTVTLFDFDGDINGGGQNCHFTRTGRAAKSVIDDRVFLEDIFAFASAVVRLGDNNNVMIINFFDEQDINDNGDTSEQIDYATQRVTAFTEAELPVCTI